MSQAFSKILIYGVGLMGSSLALALRKLDKDIQLYGVVRSTKSKEVISRMGIFHSVYIENE